MPEPLDQSWTLPPGPKGGRFHHLWERLRDNAGFFERLRAEYGDIVYLGFPFRNVCVIFDRELIQQVFVEKRASFYQGPAYKHTNFLNGPTVLTSDGDEHRRRRNLIQPSFRKQALNGYADIMIGQAEILRDEWRNGQTLDLAAAMNRLTLNIAALAFFGKDTRIDTAIVRNATLGMSWGFKLSQFPFPKLLGRLPLPQNRRAQSAFHAMDETISTIIAKARDANQERTDLISYLVRAKDEEGVDRPLDAAEVRDEAYVILMAGHETTSHAMTWMFYHLDRHPEVRERLEHEIDSVLQMRRPTLEDYEKLPYMQAVFDEAMRLTSPVYYVGREAVEDCTIGDYRIPKGTVVQLCMRAVHLDERYFPEAGRFKPERWLADAASAKPKQSYFPFGSGARKCPGGAFAKMEAVLAMATLIQRWRITAVADQPQDIESLIFYRLRNGFQVSLSERTA
ncbi:MAG: cytochrome P450 [Gammaproteobacteria bacterium]